MPGVLGVSTCSRGYSSVEASPADVALAPPLFGGHLHRQLPTDHGLDLLPVVHEEVDVGFPGVGDALPPRLDLDHAGSEAPQGTADRGRLTVEGKLTQESLEQRRRGAHHGGPHHPRVGRQGAPHLDNVLVERPPPLLAEAPYEELLQDAGADNDPPGVGVVLSPLGELSPEGHRKAVDRQPDEPGAAHFLHSPRQLQSLLLLQPKKPPLLAAIEPVYLAPFRLLLHELSP
mmetsp:Transcript_5239/g.15179  ORF Transcript_5239/g.15179 Transcript_5239/m.15179 type:complete len:231 (-) Transcript_5239:820-1512(-)